MARDELAHGWAEEAWLTALSKQRKLPFGAASGGGMAPGGPALVGYYRDRIAELHGLHEGARGRHRARVAGRDADRRDAGVPAAGVARRLDVLAAPVLEGEHRLLLHHAADARSRRRPKRLDMNEDFDRDRIWSTAAHEAMPGHFMQLSIARRHPDLIRRLQHDAAFAEGWAFYGEEMLVRLGLYGDGLDARLFTARWERVRGARAIVDPKLASGEWSVAQAVDFYEKHSGFTRARGARRRSTASPSVRATSSRTPSAGCSCRLLLAEYMLRTGERGSLRDFHDRLLSYGSTPFAVVGPELLADLDKPARAVRAAANY